MRVKSNLLLQDVFLRDTLPARDLKRGNKCSSYVSVVESVDNFGVHMKDVVEDYPITPETVKSYADSCNYRSDLHASISAKPRGVNLGDVTAIQGLSGMDTFEVRKSVESFGKAVHAYNEEMSKKKEVNDNVEK